jgi:UDPglucose 6-dehydrogenase
MNHDLEGKTVACLGLAFKPNTDDMRESPSLEILPALMEGGAKVRAYDPASMEEAKHDMPDLVYCQDAYETAKDADCLIIMTEWNQFRNLDWAKLGEIMADKVVVDLRNIYPPHMVREAGFDYVSVGRH